MNLKCHNHAYIHVLPSKHSYRPMRAHVVAQLFYKRKYQIVFKFSIQFCCSLPQPHVSKVNFILTLISMSSKPSMEDPIALIAFVILVTFWKLSPPFCSCNTQLQRMTAPPPALLLFAQFCEAVGFVDAFGSPVIILKRK